MPTPHKAILVASVLVGCLSATAYQGDSQGDSKFFSRGQSIEFLANQCRAVEKYDVSKNSVPANDAEKLEVCLGYIAGALDFDKMESHIDQHSSHLCAPDEASNSQIAKVFVKYANDHPEKLHYPAIGGLIAAIRNAFPCQE